MSDRNIDLGLEHEAQLITERMPKDMNTEQYDAVRDSLRTFLQEYKISGAAFARSVDVSASAISQFLNGKYGGNNEELCSKIVFYINAKDRQRKRRAQKPEFVDTSVAREIGRVIINTEAFSQREGKIALVVGDGGHGKSHCLQAYAQANKNAIYVELDDIMTDRGMFAEIAKAIGLDSSGSREQVSRRIIDNLEHRHAIVILDETSSLSPSKLNKLRQIIVIKSRCPLILAGNRHLIKTINTPSEIRGYESLDQFTSRLIEVLDLDSMAGGLPGGGGLYTPDDIRNLYQYGGIRLADSAVKSLLKIVRTEKSGRLRACDLIITALHTAKEVTKSGTITASAIVRALATLNLPSCMRIPISSGRIDDDVDEEKAAVG